MNLALCQRFVFFFAWISRAKKDKVQPAKMETHSMLSQPAGQFQSNKSAIDPLTATAQLRQHHLSAGSVTTEDLVDIYLAQIQRHNKKGLGLNAIIQTAPHDLLSQYAKTLDAERADGKTRGPLHGIPIILKDNIMTDWRLGMDTTCGAIALRVPKPPMRLWWTDF